MSEQLPCVDRDRIRIARYPYIAPIPNDFGTFESIIARIMWAINVATQKDMCNALGIRPALMSDAKRRQTIPASWLVRLQLQWNISPLWVLTGYIPPATPGTHSPDDLKRLMALVH